jgi:uncharacterized membrane protein
MQQVHYSPFNGSHRLPLWKAAAGVFLPSFVVFVLLDYLWITTASNVYQSHLKPILKPDVDAVAALLSWLCIVAVNQLFVLPNNVGRSAFYSLGQVCGPSWATATTTAAAAAAVEQQWQQGIDINLCITVDVGPP